MKCRWNARVTSSPGDPIPLRDASRHQCGRQTMYCHHQGVDGDGLNDQEESLRAREIRLQKEHDG